MNPEKPLRLVVQRNSHADVEGQIAGLKAMANDFQLKSMRQAGNVRGADDILTQYFARRTDASGAVGQMNRTEVTREAPTMVDSRAGRWRTVSAVGDDPILVREAAEEAKLQMEQSMIEVRKRMEAIAETQQPEIPKIATSLAQLLEARRQKQRRKETEDFMAREQLKVKADGKMSFELLSRLNTQKISKAFLTRRGTTNPLAPRPIIKCMEYCSTPEADQVLYTKNNRVSLVRRQRWRTQAPKALALRTPAYRKELGFTVLKKQPEHRDTVKKVLIWEPAEEEEQGIRGINEFIRDSMWRVTFYRPPAQERVSASSEMQGLASEAESHMSDSELQSVIDGGDRPVGETPALLPTTSTAMREDIYNPKNKAEKRRIKRDMRRQMTERQEMHSAFTNFDEGVEYLEFPKRGGKQKPLVIAADDNDPEHGTTDYYGTIQKRRATSSKFHPRWLVLKGFDLYWYRTSDSKSQKGVIKISTKAPSETYVNGLVSLPFG